MHRRFGFGLITGHNTARMASSKTVFKPFCVNAEHSKYFTEPISFAIARPWKKKLYCKLCEKKLRFSPKLDHVSLKWIIRI